MMQNYLHLLNLKSLKINLVDSLAIFVINGIVLYVYRHTRVLHHDRDRHHHHHRPPLSHVGRDWIGEAREERG